MTAKQKILKVLKHIKNDSEINPNPEWVLFEFNKGYGIGSFLTGEEERRILGKLAKGGVIETHNPNEGEAEELILNARDLFNFDLVWIKILPSFYRKYYWYNLISWADNKWNYINPAWLSWQLIQSIVFAVKWLWEKSKAMMIIFITLVGALGGLLTYNWSLAWKTIQIIHTFLFGG